MIAFHKCLHSDITVAVSGKVSDFNAFLWNADGGVLQPLHTSFHLLCVRDAQFSPAGLLWPLSAFLVTYPDSKISVIFSLFYSQGPSGLLTMKLFQSINLLCSTLKTAEERLQLTVSLCDLQK